jgi:NADH-quinone oxidoreductase subunit M
MLFSILGTSGVIWGACYLLWMYQKVFYGQIHHAENRTLGDIDRRERISLVPLVALALIMGVASPYWMKSIDPAVGGTVPKAAAQQKACPDQCTNAVVVPAREIISAAAPGGK